LLLISNRCGSDRGITRGERESRVKVVVDTGESRIIYSSVECSRLSSSHEEKRLKREERKKKFPFTAESMYNS
jgi:hypothetical protein